MQSPGRVFSREQLLDGVWGRDIYIDERTVDVHVGRLRKALNRGRETDPIRTVRGSGYSLDERFGKTTAEHLHPQQPPIAPRLHRLVRNAGVIDAIRQAARRRSPQKKKSALPGSPIGQWQVASLSSSRQRRWPIGMTLSMTSGSGSTSIS